MNGACLIVHFLLIVNRLVCPSHFSAQESMEPSSISSRILNSFEDGQDEGTAGIDGLDFSHSSDSEPSGNGEPPMKTPVLDISESVPFSNPHISKDYFLAIFKQLLEYEIRKKDENDTCLTSPSKVKFSDGPDTYYGRGGLYAERNGLFHGGSEILYPPEELNTVPPNATVTIPILSNRKSSKAKSKARFKGTRPSTFYFQNNPTSPDQSEQYPHFTLSPTEERQRIMENGYSPESSPSPGQKDDKNHRAPHSIKTPTHGFHGDYSWTIEKASPDLVEMEGILPVEEIYKAISEAEKDERKQKKESRPPSLEKYHQRLQHQNNGGITQTKAPYSHVAATDNSKQWVFAHTENNFHPERGNSKGWTNAHVENSFNPERGNSKGWTNAHVGSSNPGNENPKGWTDAHVENSFNPERGNSKGWTSLENNFKPELPLDIPSNTYSYGAGGGWGDEYNQHGSSHGDTHWTSLDGWVTKAKTIFHHVYTGEHRKITRKILELTIAVLAFLAFGGYLAALFFQSLIPSLAYPLFPGIVNVNVTNPGLLGLLFGRSLDGVGGLYILRDTTPNGLDSSVQRALNPTKLPKRLPKGYKVV